VTPVLEPAGTLGAPEAGCSSILLSAARKINLAVKIENTDLKMTLNYDLKCLTDNPNTQPPAIGGHCMAALEDLIEVVKAQTAETQRLVAVTEKLVSLRTEAIDHVKQAAAPAAEKPAAAPKKVAEPKVAAPAAEKPAEAQKTAAPTPSPVENDVTLDDVRGAIAGSGTPDPEFMKKVVAAYVNWGGTEDAPVSTEEREARKAKIKELLAHPKVNAPNVAGIPEGARKAVLKKLAEWIEALAPVEATEEVDDL
jgi:hypothetical protein